MRKEKDKSINNINFKVTQLGFEDGIELLTSLGHLIGPALLKQYKDPVTMLGELISNINSAQLKSIVHKLAKSTRIEREPNKWPLLEPEVDLAGDYNLTFKWLGFALEVNYGDFLGEEGLLKGVVATKELSQGT